MQKIKYDCYLSSDKVLRVTAEMSDRGFSPIGTVSDWIKYATEKAKEVGATKIEVYAEMWDTNTLSRIERIVYCESVGIPKEQAKTYDSVRQGQTDIHAILQEVTQSTIDSGLQEILENSWQIFVANSDISVAQANEVLGSIREPKWREQPIAYTGTFLTLKGLFKTAMAWGYLRAVKDSVEEEKSSVDPCGALKVKLEAAIKGFDYFCAEKSTYEQVLEWVEELEEKR